MERNDGENGLQGGQVEANEFSGGGSTLPQSGSTQGGASDFEFSGSAGTTGATGGTGTTGATGGTESQGLKDRARNAFGNAGGRLADVGSSVRDRAGLAKDKLAGALEAGAERLRERSQSSGGAALAGATADGATSIQGDGRIAQVSDRLAGGMERSAEWLRDAEIDGIKSGIENQVKEHPGRTLLLAVGLGYLLGRAFRGNQ